MEHIFGIDWHALFVPNTTLAEVIIRGTLIYLLLFFLMRFMRREAGQIGIADVLVVVVIADAAQNGMAGPYNSITEGVVLILTITFWDYALDWLGYHVPVFGRLIHPKPLPLIKDGRMLLRNMRRELITQEELQSRLREEGVEHMHEVKNCYMEGDGRISVISKNK
ncbi:DUF421 domain-containing protein [Stenotrophobium rhamnosiphilum]|uniref:DUF421 domain-containing protein n=1 Tax=Stenotrophobium rhamnosiphilum TaxID=2029166 RepID=A0A2T5MG69_9GAMM|nr:YetF domain-containing protein [Stenotrophobium rhamnosiphilum]PTU31560.1 DUF421 domain-containing protein [Stenotrophobium rhamnosiphilum]